MSENILVINGNPKKESFCRKLAEHYFEGCAKKYHAKLVHISEVDFDPLLHEGYDTIQPLEEDLRQLQSDFQWATHIVLVYPTWWGAMPARLKGFFDRTFLPGFAFKFFENSRQWEKLLKNKSARLIVTMDTPAWYYRLFYGNSGITNFRKMVLDFCGIAPVKTTRIGSIKHSNDKTRKRILEKVYQLGLQGA